MRLFSVFPSNHSLCVKPGSRNFSPHLYKLSNDYSPCSFWQVETGQLFKKNKKFPAVYELLINT